MPCVFRALALSGLYSDYSDTASLISGNGRMLQPDMVVGPSFPYDDDKCLRRDWSADTGESNTASVVTSHSTASMVTSHNTTIFPAAFNAAILSFTTMTLLHYIS